MAVTSLWRVRGYIGKVLLYAENPDKTANPETIPSAADANREALEDVIAYAGREAATNRRQLVTGVNCTAGTARSEMIAVKKRFRKEDGTIAYHGYQSFREGEVTPEQAHRIGIQLAEELWGERYQVLVATHVDKESHIHSHFVINTVSFVDGRKFYRSNEDYTRMREVSDRLCREYGLSVVRRPEGRRENYSAWSAEKNGKPTNRSLIRADIDRAIAASLTTAEFFQTLANMGYELHILLRFPASVPRLSAAVRQDLRKLDRLDEQTRFLEETQIETYADLDKYRKCTSNEITTLMAERVDLRNKLKRTIRAGDALTVEEMKQQIAGVSGEIKKLQESLKICDIVRQRAEDIRAQLDALQNERKEQEDELFGRSGGTGREDEPQRRGSRR